MLSDQQYQLITDLEARLSLERPSIVIDVAVVIQDVDEFQVVTLTNHEVIGVMSRGDLNSTCDVGTARTRLRYHYRLCH